MSDSPTAGPPVSDSQKQLIARLIAQGRVTMEQLREAEAFSMNRAELARWLDANVLGNQFEATLLTEIQEQFDFAPASRAK
jgi:hypothetical protein